MKCVICGAAIYGRKHKYCHECAATVHKAQMQQWRDEHAKSKTRICPTCGKQFERQERHQIYCTPACRRKNRDKYSAAYYATHREQIAARRAKK